MSSLLQTMFLSIKGCLMSSAPTHNGENIHTVDFLPKNEV